MTAVTLGRKRYAVPCVACKGLYFTYRTDSRTCGSACRVALHRNPDLDTYRLAAEGTSKMYGWHIDPFDVRLLRAAESLRPDLIEEMRRADDLKAFGPALFIAWWDRFGRENA